MTRPDTAGIFLLPERPKGLDRVPQMIGPSRQPSALSWLRGPQPYTADGRSRRRSQTGDETRRRSGAHRRTRAGGSQMSHSAVFEQHINELAGEPESVPEGDPAAIGTPAFLVGGIA